MKTLTALTVAAALATGMSVAGAQTSMQKPSAMHQKSVYSVSGHSAFCTKTTSGSQLNCKYATRAACEKIAKPGVRICMENPRMSTTGSATGMERSRGMEDTK